MDGWENAKTPTELQSRTVNKCSRGKITQKQYRFLVLCRKTVKGVRNSPGSFQSLLRWGRCSPVGWTRWLCCHTRCICQQCHLLEEMMQKGCSWSLCERLTLGTLAPFSCVVKSFPGHEGQVPNSNLIE